MRDLEQVDNIVENKARSIVWRRQMFSDAK
jgi:hypothetical protein